MIKTKTMTFDIKSLGSKKIGLYKSQKQLGVLAYDSSFSKDCGTIEINNAPISIFKNKGFLNSEIQIVRGNQIMFSIFLQLAGNLEIRSEYNNKKYWLKSKDFWKETKVLVDENGKELVTLSKKINWSKLNYDYSFQTTDDFELLPEKELFLLALIQGEQKRQMNIAMMIVFFVVIFSATNH